MPRIPVTIALLAIGLSLSQPVQGATALEMSSFCEPIGEATLLNDGTALVDQSATAQQCWGAFLALQGVTTIKFTGDTIPALHICAPETSTLIQLVRIFRAYVDQHPERGHEDFVLVALPSLIAAFPCE